MEEISCLLAIIGVVFASFIVWYGKGDKGLRSRILSFYLTQDKEKKYIKIKEFLTLGENENTNNNASLKLLYRSYYMLRIGQIINGILSVSVLIFGVFSVLDGNLKDIIGKSSSNILSKEIVVFFLSLSVLIIISVMLHVWRTGVFTTADDLEKESQIIRQILQMDSTLNRNN